jgi:prolyl oligopeptidase
VLSDFDASKYTTSQVFFPSKDGTEIPMFIVHKNDVVLDGSNKALLYGYGGFSISLTPSFSPSRLLMLEELGGVYCVANLRGGAEYGEAWHKGGVKGNKQNVFDDFQGAAKFLHSKGYTTPSRTAIMGGSNGGLLVGACVNQAPELFACAGKSEWRNVCIGLRNVCLYIPIPIINMWGVLFLLPRTHTLTVAAVGVMDMLRFHKFTIGYAWVSDFGSADVEEEFEHLIKYSPVHNVRPVLSDSTNEPVNFPAVLATTADHDDRVVPLHSYKYISELQHQIGGLGSQTNPLIIRVDTKSGHGAGKPIEKQIEESAQIFAFIDQFTA